MNSIANGPLHRVLSRLDNVKANGNGFTARCPAHGDRENSLSIAEGGDGRVLIKCFTGCTAKAIVAAAGLQLRDLFSTTEVRHGRSIKRSATQTPPDKLPATAATSLDMVGLTLAELAGEKHLPEKFLRDLGITDVRRRGVSSVNVPYRSIDGQILAVRRRLAIHGPRRFAWRTGDKLVLYGLDRLSEVRAAGWALLVEGESDCWTAWQWGLPALGVPGKATWRPAWRDHLKGISIFLWQEPDAEDLTCKVARDVPGLYVIVAPNGAKDLSEAHLQGRDVRALIDALKANAVSADDRNRQEADQRNAAHREAAQPVFAGADPVARVKEAIRALGYGGTIEPAVITYLALSSRLLGMRQGTMPVHLLLVGQPSAGKSYTLKTVLRLLPPEAYQEIDAGSPRTLIYGRADLRHRAVIFGEADSLPAGEDNPAASAVRNLLQDHQLRYSVAIRDPRTGDFTVREIDKPGPTVLVTSAVRRLGAQLDSRVFVLEIPDDHVQVHKALEAQAEIELHGRPEPDGALIAYQAYLQAAVPWDVVIPFVRELTEAIARTVTPIRILRDFSRLVSLIKTVSVLRHDRRRRDDRGRLVAELDDYAVVYDLVRNMYETSVLGTSPEVRAAVAMVKQLTSGDDESVSITQLAQMLDIEKMTASRRVKIALKHGWLVNAEKVRGRPAKLTVGEPLPEKIGLPTPETLRAKCNTVPSLTETSIDEPEPPNVSIETSSVDLSVNSVTPLHFESGYDDEVEL